MTEKEYEIMLFNFFMSLALLKRAHKVNKEKNPEKLKEIAEYGKIYSALCLIK